MSARRDLKLDKYEISKFAFRELSNFCKQYSEKKVKLSALRGVNAMAMSGLPKGGEISNPTEKKALRADQLSADCELIEKTAMEIDSCMYPWLLRAVTEEGATWNLLVPPCGLNQFNASRRRFFYLLAAKKGMI